MLGELLALASAVVWALSVILFKQSEAVQPQALNLFKNVVAIVLLSLTMWAVGDSIEWTRSAEDWGLLALSGVLGIAIADTLIFVGLRHLGPGLLAVVDCSYAPTTVLFAVLFLGESISGAFLVGAVLVVGGVFFAVRDGQVAQQVDPARLRVGIAAALTGIVSMALGIVVVKRVLEDGDLVEITLLRVVAGVIGQLIWIGWDRRRWSALAVFRPSRVWRTLLPASILGSWLAMLCWLGGFKYTDASTASVLNQTTTVFTMGFAWLILGDRISARRAIGAVLAIAGALLVLQA